MRGPASPVGRRRTGRSSSSVGRGAPGSFRPGRTRGAASSFGRRRTGRSPSSVGSGPPGSFGRGRTRGPAVFIRCGWTRRSPGPLSITGRGQPSRAVRRRCPGRPARSIGGRCPGGTPGAVARCTVAAGAAATGARFLPGASGGRPTAAVARGPAGPGRPRTPRGLRRSGGRTACLRGLRGLRRSGGRTACLRDVATAAGTTVAACPSPLRRSVSLSHANQPPASATTVPRQTKRAARPHRERPSSRMSGGVLLSHAVPRAVPSALKGLTSGFGMGPGVSPTLLPPKLY
jgi:hypothetical protein